MGETKAIAVHLLGDLNRFTLDLQSSRIEWLRHKQTITHQQQITWVGVNRIRSGIQKQPGLGRVDRANVNAGEHICGNDGKVEKVSSVWQKMRFNVPAFSAGRIQTSDWNRYAAAGRNSEDPVSPASSEEDDVVPVPCTPTNTGARNLAYGLRQSSTHFNLFQLA